MPNQTGERRQGYWYPPQSTLPILISCFTNVCPGFAFWARSSVISIVVFIVFCIGIWVPVFLKPYNRNKENHVVEVGKASTRNLNRIYTTPLPCSQCAVRYRPNEPFNSCSIKTCAVPRYLHQHVGQTFVVPLWVHGFAIPQEIVDILMVHDGIAAEAAGHSLPSNR